MIDDVILEKLIEHNDLYIQVSALEDEIKKGKIDYEEASGELKQKCSKMRKLYFEVNDLLKHDYISLDLYCQLEDAIRIEDYERCEVLKKEIGKL